MSGQPVILCGKTEQIGSGVISGLKPEYEVVHFVMTPESGNVQIPLILSGKGKEAPSDSQLGSHDYSRTPIAIVTGGAFEEDHVAAFLKAIAETPGTTKVPILCVDTSKPAPPLGPEYGKAMCLRVKETLAGLLASNDMRPGQVVLY